MSITVRKLSAPLGAEIVGADLSQPLDDADVEAIKRAWHDHLVLLFRGQDLSEDAQIRFARYFGAPQKRPRPPSARAETGVANPEIVMLVSNIRKDGKPIGSLPDGEMQFHTDQCYMERPAQGTCLYAIEVPAQGGDTLFLNLYKAYETLSPDQQQRLQGLKAENIYLYGTTSRDAAKPDFDVHRHHAHPVVRTHPATGRKALYVNRLMTWNIVGVDEAESERLLTALFDHLEQDDFIYAHKWRPGDLVLWDNRCTLHARTDFSDRERRLLRRVAIEGDVPA
jgi:taurine dioxygenase